MLLIRARDRVRASTAPNEPGGFQGRQSRRGVAAEAFEGYPEGAPLENSAKSLRQGRRKARLLRMRCYTVQWSWGRLDMYVNLSMSVCLAVRRCQSATDFIL